MDLDNLIDTIKNFPGVTRKKPIKEIINKLRDIYNVSGNTLDFVGDDAAAILLSDDLLLLMAADGIMSELINRDPYWAGYCSVLVNVNDIAAMGGKPVGMTNILSIKNMDCADELINGIKDASKKFNVPMVGGHMHPDADFNSLDVSIAGIVAMDDIINSSGANIGDDVVFAIDLDGHQHPGFPFNWDTTSFKDSRLVCDQIGVMNLLGSKNLVSAAKDISNPGMLGTLGMLLESSAVGASVDLLKIPYNDSVSWVDWLRLYIGAGFVLTCNPEDTGECIDLFESVGLTASVVGEVISDEKLYLNYDGESKVLFDFKVDGIVGMREDNLVV